MAGKAGLASRTDEQLAYQAQCGCAASFEELLRRFQTPVLAFLRQRGSTRDAEDVLQETFLRAYENLHRYRPRWAFSTWLFTIARRTSINYCRREQPDANSPAAEAATSAGRQPIEELMAVESRQRMWEVAAAALTEEQVTAVWLHYVEEMPTEEIARVLGRSRGSVKTMLFRARKRLLPLLSEFDEGIAVVDGVADEKVGTNYG
ncbi:MAG: sigma-70 family RNA polymerase sigma factor [Planctomycetaceae bacterium]|nr:sigma-70 family RNA polymerase sigma factor [Planctomycetaceae bacterium]